EDPRDRAVQAQQAAITLLERDVAGEPPVTDEAPVRVERRAAADADKSLVARPLLLQDEVGERLPRVEHAPVSLPAPFVDRHDIELPRRPAEYSAARAGAAARRPPYREAVPLVELPVAVERQPDDALKAALALRKRLAQLLDLLRRVLAGGGPVRIHNRPHPVPAAWYGSAGEAALICIARASPETLICVSFPRDPL